MTNTKKGLRESESKELAERIRINQQKLSSELRTKFDYIVVGAGTSGSVVAGRLASDLNTQVLLLEAGAAKMSGDKMSVVDGRLKVYGVDSLRIADASITRHDR